MNTKDDISQGKIIKEETTSNTSNEKKIQDPTVTSTFKEDGQKSLTGSSHKSSPSRSSNEPSTNLSSSSLSSSSNTTTFTYQATYSHNTIDKKRKRKYLDNPLVKRWFQYQHVNIQPYQNQFTQPENTEPISVC